MFFKGSRYAAVKTLEWIDPCGRTIRYKATRWIGTLEAVAMHVIRDGDRLDLLADSHYHDAERFWRICDANTALWPDDLLRPVGRRIGVPATED